MSSDCPYTIPGFTLPPASQHEKAVGLGTAGERLEGDFSFDMPIQGYVVLAKIPYKP